MAIGLDPLLRLGNGLRFKDGTSVRLGPCTGLGQAQSTEGPQFSWKDPDDVSINGAVLAYWNRTVLVRKVGGFPTSPTDGVVIGQTSRKDATKNYFENTNLCDTTQEDGVEYGYMLFSQAVNGAWNNLDENRFAPTTGMSWSMVRSFVRSGGGAEVFPIGSVFFVAHPEYTHLDGTGIHYRVISHDTVQPADQTLTRSMLLDPADCLFSAPYDYNEATYALTEDTVATVGKTYYTLSGSTYTALVEGTDYEIGDTVPMATWYEKNLDNRNNGSNNFPNSNLLQWMNSSGVSNSWFTKKTIWDTCSSTLLSKNGFCRFLDPAFLAAVAEAKLITAKCTPEGGGSFTTYAKFFPLSLTQVFGTSVNGIYEGTQAEYYASNDKTKTLMDSVSNTNWWLRSPYATTANSVFYVNTSGSGPINYAYYASGVSPACIIA